MKIINHSACNAVIGAPEDMQDGSCESLPVAYQTTNDGTFAVSFWEPDATELAVLAQGGGIALWVRAQGRQHPVVAVGTYEDDTPHPKETDIVLLYTQRCMQKQLASLSALQMILGIADGSTTVNSLPNLARIARAAIRDLES